jgi:hypothetical protein
MSASERRSRVHGLLTRPGQVLLARTGHDRGLPAVELEGNVSGELGRTADALEGVLGGSVALLRQVDRRSDDEEADYEVVWEVELLRSDWEPPPGLEWTDAHALAALPFQREDHRELVIRILGEPISPRRAPWARPGWHAEATGWIERSLPELGSPASGSTEQVRTWSLSSVMRTPTAGGDVYFKATADLPLFVDEGRVMRALSRMFPRHVPSPLAVDARGWMLLEDVGPALGWNAPLDEREAALALWGGLQVASTSRVDELIDVGCIDRRPEWLAREIGALLADDASLAGLDDDELARLRALEPRLRELCRRLAAGAVPNALVHGDLHTGNVALHDGRYTIFDWSDAAVAHPFLDLVAVLWEEDPAARETLLAAYLAAWGEYATTERLRELWQVAEPLLSLNQAVSYRFIAAGVEPGSPNELAGAITSWLRRALSAELEALSL